MINRLRFELSFKNIAQLEKKLNFCKSNSIKNINIPCKGLIKKDFFNLSYDFIQQNFRELNVVYHYSLFHQYSKNRLKSYQDFIEFCKKCNSNKNCEILLVSGSRKKKNFDVLDVLYNLKSEKNLKLKLGIAYNPYLNSYFNISSERDRLDKKISSGLIKSIWLQFGTDINLLAREFDYLQKQNQDININFFGSLFIPSKLFISRFQYRPWKGVYIANKYLNSLESFYDFTKDLINFYLANNITPVIETDFSTSAKLEVIQSLLKNRSQYFINI